ncbi:hypothetical protein [Arthrobacter agilis]|nr:hypothetical protein [Arthrobacter agilis]
MGDESAGWQDVVVADSLIRVSISEPVAVIRNLKHPDRVITWADLPVGLINPHMRVAAASTGVWVLYTPATADEMREDEGTASQVISTAIHISQAGDVTWFMDLMNVHLIGTTRHGAWLWSGRSDVNVDDQAQWLKARELLLLDAGGRTHRTSIDRIPLLAFEAGSSPYLVVYASAPEALHDRYGGTGYTYRYQQIEVPTGGLPAVLRANELPSTPIEEIDIPGWSEGDAPQINPVVAGDPHVSWDRVNLPEEQKKAAVEALCAEFDRLESYWRTPGGEMVPLTDGVADARVDVVGDWPQTQVEVSFIHPHYRQGRLRRTYRVFDDAGRIKSWQYASIHLMEDLDTGVLPPHKVALNTILDI